MTLEVTDIKQNDVKLKINLLYTNLLNFILDQSFKYKFVNLYLWRKIQMNEQKFIEKKKDFTFFPFLNGLYAFQTCI